jgi:hypothetical protein
MCLSAILKLFQKPKLPHPEEPPNPAQTMENTNPVAIMEKWFDSYNVPVGNRQYFRDWLIVKLVKPLNYTYIENGITYIKEVPSMTYWDGTVRHIDIEPEYCNPGVFAHEAGGHGAYALLSSGQKVDFNILFDSMKNTDPKLVYLWSVNNYGLSSDVEGHAETYRYWGNLMPECLKQYYPRLF